MALVSIVETHGTVNPMTNLGRQTYNEQDELFWLHPALSREETRIQSVDVQSNRRGQEQDEYG